MSYDPQPVDMSQIVAGGDSNAIVTGLIVQELIRTEMLSSNGEAGIISI
ncbi:MAG: hypothetical protein R3A12_08390 [Ignavibacteria bacterium]